MIRTGALLAAGALILLSAPAAYAQPRRPLSANPSAVVKAQLALARLAREKGQWTALRETADKDAVLFAPDAVNAPAWLRKRADPRQPVDWQPRRIFTACDGSYAAATGPWAGPDGAGGSFITIWRRQPKGDYKWLLTLDGGTPLPAQDDPVIEGHVAQCAPRDRAAGPERSGKRPDKAAVIRIAIPPPPGGEGQSDDGSLRWRWSSGAGAGGSALAVTMRQQGVQTPILQESAVPGESAVTTP